MPSDKSADALARDHAKEAIGILHDIMVDPLAENKDRLRAAESLLERGHGKAVSAVISIPVQRRQAAQMASMSDEELLEAIRQTPLPRLVAAESRFNCGQPQCPGDHAVDLEVCAELIDPLLL